MGGDRGPMGGDSRVIRDIIKIIDFKAIILIYVPSQLFSMAIWSFDMSSIYEFEGKLEEFARSESKFFQSGVLGAKKMLIFLSCF